MWRRTFPELEITVHTRYLDLWNKDRFGHAMPWITAIFSYKCPDSEKTYGLLDHLCGQVFSDGDDPRVPAQVHLLLQPRPGFNHPLAVEASKWNYLSGFATGFRGGRTKHEKERDDGFAWATSLYSMMNSFMTLSGRIDDLWMNEGHCYFKPLLRLEWRILSETVCERLHRDANAGVMGAVKAATFESVRLKITGVDFFSYSAPVLWGFLDEGVLSINAGSGLLKIQIDTDPRNEANFERSKSTAQNVRAAGLVLKGLGSFFGNKNDKRH